MPNLVEKTVLNRYHVREFLGRGGMAEVYKVWDSQRMSFLAMKILHEDLALDKIFIRRFAREANNLARLQHPNIVRFFGFEKQERFAFMLMDYIEGETLKHLIHDSKKALPLDQLHAIMQGVCGALHYAHNTGVVHCDIKPANIMMDRSGNVQLADFGIARMSDSATATMVGAGTPAYMAPEQIRGEDPSPQTDIYALGIALYEMLTGGERPFTGNQAQITGGTGEKVRWEHLNLSPPSPRGWNPDLSPELERVVLKSLAKYPAERYTNILAFRNALELALAGRVSEGKGTRDLQARIAQNLSGISPRASEYSSQGDQEISRLPSSAKNRNLFITIFAALFFVAAAFFWGSHPLDKPTVTQGSFSSTVFYDLPGATSTPYMQITPTQEIPPTFTATFTPQPSDTPTPTFTNSPIPLPATPILSVEFVDPAHIQSYVAKYPVLGELAAEYYSWDERSHSNITLPFTITMSSSQIVVWRWYWCATTQDILDSNMADFSPKFTINGNRVSQDNFLEISFTHEENGQKCAGLVAALENWRSGKYELVQRISYDNEIYDGIDIYEPGSRTQIYSITVK